MHSDPEDLPPLREVIRALGLTAKKSLGQNFILEVGPGPGGLTRALLSEGAEQVIAVEKDARFLPALAMIGEHFPGRLEIVEADALEVNWAALLPPGRSARIIANLPYSVATPLLTGWLKTEPWPPWWDRMVLMFQREVAERIVAPVGGKAYGRLAVLSQWRAQVRILFHLPPAAFTPPPKVASTLVEFIPRPEPLPVGGAAMLEAVTAAAFGQRRKMLRASLKGLPGALEALEKVGIDPSQRAEQISVADFCALAAAIAAARAERTG